MLLLFTHFEHSTGYSADLEITVRKHLLTMVIAGKYMKDLEFQLRRKF